MVNKTVVVTGASGGIGSAIAHVFAENGWNVAMMYCNSEKEALELEKEIKEQGVKTFCRKCNVASVNEVKEFFDAAEKELGQIHALVNNAGVALQKLFTGILLLTH